MNRLSLAVPVLARGLVVDLYAVAVGVLEVYAQRQAVVRDALDGHVLFLQIVVEIGQVFQAAHAPRHVVQAHLPGAGAVGVLAHFHQRNLVGLVQVGRHEGGAAFLEVIGVQSQDGFVPIAGILGVADVDVHVAQVTGCVSHSFSPLRPTYCTLKLP